MPKIVFINAYEIPYLGTRILASYMLAKGYATHNVILCSGEYVRIDSPLEKHEGYQSFSRGKLNVNKATHYKVSEADLFHLENVLKAEVPDVIGFSARSTNNWLIPVLMPVFRSAAPGALVVGGGFGPTLEPELYLDGGFDCVIRGDGEEPLAELMKCVEEDDLAKARSIRNTVWKGEEGKIIANPLRPQEKNLSKYGMPLHGNQYFSYINEGILRRFYDPMEESSTYFTYFGRGCIGHCTYCSGGQWASLYRECDAKVYKRRNREIPELMDELKKMPPAATHVWFVDEYFGLSSQKTLEFCELYKKYIHKTFFCYLNYEYMLEHKDIFYKLVDAGLIGTGIGFQTGSEAFASEQYHRKHKNADLIRYAELCFDTNIYTGIHIIGGNCYETPEVFRETVELMRRLPYSIEDPWRMPIENIKLRPHPRTPITYLSPRVVSDPMSATEWLYRGVLLEFARLLGPEEYEEVAADAHWRADPVAFNTFFMSALKSRQLAHFSQVKASLEGKPVIFYGAGTHYAPNKAFFRGLDVKAFLIDSPYATPAHIDGIPAYDTADFLTHEDRPDEFTYITFITDSFLPRINLHIRHGIANNRIHCVTSNFSVAE